MGNEKGISGLVQATTKTNSKSLFRKGKEKNLSGFPFFGNCIDLQRAPLQNCMRPRREKVKKLYKMLNLVNKNETLGELNIHT